MRYAIPALAFLLLLAACAERPIACQMDAKICPDGTGVGRTGPDCEFAPCPAGRYILCAQEPQYVPDGWTCVDACPPGHDEYGAQIGRVCVQHYGEDDIAAWPTCASSRACGELTCGKATVTTLGEEVDDPQFRCLPNDYQSFMVHRGLELADGGMVIA